MRWLHPHRGGTPAVALRGPGQSAANAAAFCRGNATPDTLVLPVGDGEAQAFNADGAIGTDGDCPPDLFRLFREPGSPVGMTDTEGQSAPGLTVRGWENERASA